MAFKVLKRDVATMSQAQLLLNFELCVIEMTKEVNFSRGVSKTTNKSYDLLKEQLLDVLQSDETYDNDFEIVKR